MGVELSTSVCILHASPVHLRETFRHDTRFEPLPQAVRVALYLENPLALHPLAML
jgi:3-dehydroquinate dehydratase